MIKQFRNLTPVNLFFLVLIAFLLRIPVLSRLPEVLEFNFLEPFIRVLLVVPTEGLLSPELNVFLALVLVLLQAIWINRIVNQYNLLGKPAFLPALMYVTVSATFESFFELNPALLCNFLLIWMIEKFLSIYRRKQVYSVMFDMGILVGVGTLIYFPFISMFFLLLVSLLIFRPFNWREWVSGLVGFATVYFFLAVFYYWNDSLDKFYQIWLPLTNPFPSKIRIDFYDYIVLIPLLLILILAAFSIRQNFFRSYVQIRKAFQLLFVLFILVMISFYLKQQVYLYHFLLAVPPVSIFSAYYFLHARKRWFYESLYVLLLIFIVYFQIA